MAKSFKLTNETCLDSKSVSHKKKTLYDILELIDYTDQCSCTNSTFGSGKVCKIGKLVIFQIRVKATITSGWKSIFKIPKELYPIELYDYGCGIAGSSFYVYGSGNNTGHIMGAITEGTEYNIQGVYIARN